MPKYLFFDIDTKLLKTYHQVLKGVPDVEVLLDRTDVKNLENVTAYVSPANSYGWMSGGIDAVYSHMFPGVERLVQDNIQGVRDYIQGRREEGGTSYMNRPHLPVGGAILCDLDDGYDVDDANHQYIVCAPTMDTPSDIRNTPENIYYAVYAILKVCSAALNDDEVVAIPGLGTGVGNLSVMESGLQVRKAFDDFHAGRTPRYYYNNFKVSSGKGYYVVHQ